LDARVWKEVKAQSTFQKGLSDILGTGLPIICSCHDTFSKMLQFFTKRFMILKNRLKLKRPRISNQKKGGQS
jgi:hypothetical protein